MTMDIAYDANYSPSKALTAQKENKYAERQVSLSESAHTSKNVS